MVMKFIRPQKPKENTKDQNHFQSKDNKTYREKLKAKKTYYFKVRAYKKNGKQKLFGTYSKVLKVKM